MTTPPTGRDEMPERLFPVQLFGMIPWAIAQLAYIDYAKRYGTNQSLERIAQRGGFGVDEMDLHFPGWRNAIAGITALRNDRDWLQAALDKAQRERDEARMALLTGEDEAVLRRMLDDGISALNEKRLSLFERAYPGGVPTQSLRPAIQLILRTIVHHIPDSEVVK